MIRTASERGTEREISKLIGAVAVTVASVRMRLPVSSE